MRRRRNTTGIAIADAADHICSSALFRTFGERVTVGKSEAKGTLRLFVTRRGFQCGQQTFTQEKPQCSTDKNREIITVFSSKLYDFPQERLINN